MGSDASIAVLSDRSRMLYDYFTQLFAQVTNPPLDAVREELVHVARGNRLGPKETSCTPGPARADQILLPQPVIDRDDLAKLLYVNEQGETPGFKAFAIDCLFPVSEAGRPGGDRASGAALAAAIEDVRYRVSAAIPRGPTSSCSRTATRLKSSHRSPLC